MIMSSLPFVIPSHQGELMEGVLSDMGLGSATLSLPLRSQLCHLCPRMPPALSALGQRLRRSMSAPPTPPHTALLKATSPTPYRMGPLASSPFQLPIPDPFPRLALSLSKGGPPIWEVWGSEGQLITKFDCFLEFLKCEKEISPGDPQRRRHQQCWVLWVMCYQGDFREYLFLIPHSLGHSLDC